MKIALSGATGFIGRHVLAELVKRDAEVVALVRRGAEARVAASGRVKVVAADVHDAATGLLERLGRPDVLLHLAWAGLPNYNSLHHFEQELPAQHRFLATLVREGLPALVAAGTCFEYGMQSGPLAVSTPPRPTNAYGYAKDCLHRQLRFLRAQHEFHLSWARMFYVYGDGQPANSIYPQLKQAIARGDARFPMSAGEQLRDYLPVEEMARKLADLALLRERPPLLNVCSGRPTSVRGLVESWLRQNGWKIELDLGRYPYPDYEPMAFWGVPGATHDDVRAG